MKGRLFVVATPIGNLKDITFRAVETLKSVSVIVAEDTRVSQKLLNHLGIEKKIISNFKENEHKRVSEIIEILKGGEDVALLSDAGTPAISDPGTLLVNKAREEGFEIFPVAGPSSLTTALSVCGFESTPFIFYGFFPRKEREKERVIGEINTFPYTVVFFESPFRIKRTLQFLYENIGERDIFVAREMTKKFESYLLNPKVDDLVEKGEFVIVLSPPKLKGKKEFDKRKMESYFEELLKEGYSKKEAIKIISHKFKISKNLLYNDLIVRKGG